MKKHLLFWAVMFAISSFVTAQTVAFSDNFDSYPVGSHLSQVNSAWTTWTGTPGGSDDGIISSTQAYSTPNSLYIEEEIDQLYPFRHPKRLISWQRRLRKLRVKYKNVILLCL